MADPAQKRVAASRDAQHLSSSAGKLLKMWNLLKAETLETANSCWNPWVLSTLALTTLTTNERMEGVNIAAS